MRRLGSLLLTAAAIFVFLALFGLAIYVGVFLFLAVAVYLLIAGIKDDFYAIAGVAVRVIRRTMPVPG